MKFKVILDIEYKTNGIKKGKLKELLLNSMEHLVDEGLLTGNTPAELLNFSINIIE